MNTYLLIYLIISWLTGFFIWYGILSSKNTEPVKIKRIAYFLLVFATPVFIPMRLIFKLVE